MFRVRPRVNREFLLTCGTEIYSCVAMKTTQTWYAEPNKYKEGHWIVSRNDGIVRLYFNDELFQKYFERKSNG